MSDRTLTIILIGLLVPISAILYRFLGSPAIGIAIWAAISLVAKYRRDQWGRRADILANLRRKDLVARMEALGEIEDQGLRDSIAHELKDEGTVLQVGDVEQFPFPKSFARNLRKRYWISWTASAVTLGIAALVPDLLGVTRLVILVFGIACARYAWRMSKYEHAVQSAVEISQVRISEISRDGRRRTIPLSSAVRIDTTSDPDDLWIEFEGQRMLLSHHLIGFDRLEERVYRYTGHSREVTGDLIKQDKG
jgi:hypothetical protein